jgi:Ribbon-helix-helix protein, copG family
MSLMGQWFFRIPASERKAVEEQARKEDRSASAVIRRSLRLYLAAATNEGADDPIRRAGMWLSSLPDEIRPEIYRLGEALAAWSQSERASDFPPPELPSKATGTSADPDSQRRARRSRGRK